jgi:molybdopterin-guanine dinucleotide biosynthesis protein A
MSTHFPGVILSGGRSLRMGQRKALLPFGPARLIDHVAARLAPQVSEILLNSNEAAIALPGATRFDDSYAGFQGPLAGIHASLDFVARRIVTVTHVAIIAVDTPFFPTDLVARLATALEGPDDVALAMSSGRLHPVIGLWPLSATDRLAGWLDNPPTLKVRAFLDTMPVRTTSFASITTRLGDLDPFFNVNTEEDLRFAREIGDAAEEAPSHRHPINHGN